MQPDQTYSEQLTKKILARAIELDDLGAASYSEADLRAIARETGITEAALNNAIRELATAEAPQVRAKAGKLRFAALAAAGAVAGPLTAIIDLGTTAFFVPASPLAMGVLLMLSGGAAVAEPDHRPMRRFLSFQMKNSVLWLTYAGTYWLTGVPELGGVPIWGLVMLRTAAFGYGASTLAGALMSAFHATRRLSSGAHEGAAPVSLKTRIAETVKRWIDIWARRVDKSKIDVITVRSVQ